MIGFKLSIFCLCALHAVGPVLINASYFDDALSKSTLLVCTCYITSTKSEGEISSLIPTTLSIINLAVSYSCTITTTSGFVTICIWSAKKSFQIQIIFSA